MTPVAFSSPMPTPSSSRSREWSTPTALAGPRCSSSAGRGRAEGSSARHPTRRASSAFGRRCRSRARCACVRSADVCPVPRRACGEKSREIRAVLDTFAPVVQGREHRRMVSRSRRNGGDLPQRATRCHRGVESARRFAARRRCPFRSAAERPKLVAKLAVERAKPKPGTAATGVCVVEAGSRGGVPLYPRAGGNSIRRPALSGTPRQARYATLFPTCCSTISPRSRSWLGQREAEWLSRRVRGIDGTAARVARRSEEHQPRRYIPGGHR